MALVNKTFTVNGKSYPSIEEMPPEVRALYERVMAAKSGAPSPGTKLKFSAKLNFNGKEYDSPDAMPPEVRRLYEDAVALLSKEERGATTLRVESDARAEIVGQLAARKRSTVRLAWIVLGILVALLVFFAVKPE